MPLAQRHTEEADHVEHKALTYGASVVDSGLYGDRISGVAHEFEIENAHSGPQESWHRLDIAADEAVGNIGKEIERRSRILGPAYPFKLNGGTLHYYPGQMKMYEFMLSVSCSPDLTKGKFADIPRTFERVATVLVARYFGDYAKGWHTGWPRDGRTSFQDIAQKLNECTGEWVWEPQHDDLDFGSVKDEGCDFVVWLTPSDQRKIGSLFVLGQCACGNDWQVKYQQLSIEKLRRWFNPLSYVRPVRSFATPRHVEDVTLREASRQAGLLFDRARLTAIALHTKADLFEAQMLQLMNDAIQLVREGLP